jgi:hypothetical protein
MSGIVTEAEGSTRGCGYKDSGESNMRSWLGGDSGTATCVEEVGAERRGTVSTVMLRRYEVLNGRGRFSDFASLLIDKKPTIRNQDCGSCEGKQERSQQKEVQWMVSRKQ